MAQRGHEARDLVWENGPNVSTNANTSDSHYEASAGRSATIHEGDFVLIDIWGRADRPEGVFYDITWTGVVGREPTDREQLVFETVRNGRDAAISVVEKAFADGRIIRGFEADDAARAVIVGAGFGEFFTHRTGHNIAHEIHGPGAHLDNLETHDVRRILPHTCFSVEPGIYLPEFGVRSEVDMLTAPDRAWVTGQVQRELVRISPPAVGQTLAIRSRKICVAHPFGDEAEEWMGHPVAWACTASVEKGARETRIGA